MYDNEETWIYAKYSFYVDSENFTINSRCFSLDCESSYKKILKKFLDTYDLLLERIDAKNNLPEEIRSLASLIIEINC